MKRYFTSLAVFILICLTPIFSWSQNPRTVGTMGIGPNAAEGYTLFSPASNKMIYLINNCGEVMHSWTSEYSPGNAVYLLEDGYLYRAGRLGNQDIHAGGGGGIIEKLDWESNVVWSYTYNTSLYRSHHDFQVLPNGNVLILAWEYISGEEAIANGRNPELMTDNQLWPEHVIEVEPTGSEGGNIVWEWHAWDHLIQDFDDTKENYGAVGNQPGKIDINYIRPNEYGADWMHANSINYNKDLDQIMLSVLHFDEIWVIDHGISTVEASGDKGDLLFRWGNPQTYRKGSKEDKQLFGQHNAHWIEPGLPDAGKVLIFNNGRDRGEDLYTSVVKIDVQFNEGQYSKNPDGSFYPETFYYEFVESPPTDFYSRFISGAQQLANGNILINDGAHGTFFEIEPNEEKAWIYVNPVATGGIVAQGDSVVNSQGVGTNTVFRATKLPVDYAAFDGKSLEPGDPIELNPDFFCDVISITTSEASIIQIYPQPVNDKLYIEQYRGRYALRALNGRVVSEGFVNNSIQLDLIQLSNGVYLLELDSGESRKIIISR